MTNVVKLFPKQHTFEDALKKQTRKKRKGKSAPHALVAQIRRQYSSYISDDEPVQRDAEMLQRAIRLAKPGSKREEFLISVDRWRESEGQMTPKQRAVVESILDDLEGRRRK